MTSLYICDETDVVNTAPLCRNNMFGIEVQAFYDPATDGDDDLVTRHRDMLEGITNISLHGPFGDLCAGSFDPMVRDVARYRFEFAYETARSLGATNIVLHHGYVPGTSPPKGWVPRFADFWDSFSAGKAGDVRFHLENMLEHDPEIVLESLSAITQDNVDACLDIGHAHCNSRLSVVQWIEALGNRIGYVHLHDNHGESDEHLGLGQGTIPMDDVCSALVEHCPDAIWAIECVPKAREHSLAWLRKRKYL